jgi:hypothetical protein
MIWPAMPRLLSQLASIAFILSVAVTAALARQNEMRIFP